MSEGNAVSISARATLAPTPTLPSLDREIRHALNKLISVGPGFAIKAVDAPTPKIRRELEIRLSQLKFWLRPAGDGALGDTALGDIASVLKLPARGGSIDDARVNMEMYDADLYDVPLFARRAACADFRQGRAGNGYRPTQREIRILANRHAEPARAEKRRIEKILSAKIDSVVIDPEQRERNLRGLRELSADVKLHSRMTVARCSGKPYLEPPKPETSAETLERLRALNASTPVDMSAELRRKTHEKFGIDPEVWEDEQRLRKDHGEPEERCAAAGMPG